MNGNQTNGNGKRSIAFALPNVNLVQFSSHEILTSQMAITGQREEPVGFPVARKIGPERRYILERREPLGAFDWRSSARQVRQAVFPKARD